LGISRLHRKIGWAKIVENSGLVEKSWGSNSKNNPLQYKANKIAVDSSHSLPSEV
jgi:hypothetical protein